LTDTASIEAFVDGKIDEIHVLPAVGLTYRPLEGLALRAAYSQTIARPSFREMGFYVSVEPATDDLIVGNPQLVESRLDARVEYFWVVRQPHGRQLLLQGRRSIEHHLRDASNFGGGGDALFRTFFNNENQATLQGFEVEARKNLGLFGFEFGEYLSIGGNFTYIDATVKRSEAELSRAAPFFAVKPGDPERFDEYEEERRLSINPSGRRISTSTSISPIGHGLHRFGLRDPSSRCRRSAPQLEQRTFASRRIATSTRSTSWI
jgi:hypothetical protein